MIIYSGQNAHSLTGVSHSSSRGNGPSYSQKTTEDPKKPFIRFEGIDDHKSHAKAHGAYTLHATLRPNLYELGSMVNLYV